MLYMHAVHGDSHNAFKAYAPSPERWTGSQFGVTWEMTPPHSSLALNKPLVLLLLRWISTSPSPSLGASFLSSVP